MTASSQVELWPCGCPKGMTPHGIGWKDCIFSNEQKEEWVQMIDDEHGAELLEISRLERADRDGG